MLSNLELTPEQRDHVRRCEQTLDICFSDPSLLLAALTHSSGAPSSKLSNERLEFLGDSILGFLVCRYLYTTYPEWNEGELTKFKSAVVSGEVCAEWAKQLGLPEFLLVGKGVAQNGELPPSLLGDAFEAVIAAIFLDQGFDAIEKLLHPLIAGQVTIFLQCAAVKNFKSTLQQITQRDYGYAPTYHVIAEKGPDHAKLFQVVVQIGNRRFDSAWGKSKKDAEQKAAGNALSALGFTMDLNLVEAIPVAGESTSPDSDEGV